jgi:Amt family ammonium transporter
MVKQSLFDDCLTFLTNENNVLSHDVIRCISKHYDALEKEQKDIKYDMMEWMFIFSGALVFFMQAGFAMICAGCVRKKNLHNTMLKNFLDICVAAIAFYFVGFGFAFGGQNDSDKTTFIGTTNFLALGGIDPAFWVFQFLLSATAVTIVAGTLAERCKMVAYLWYSLFLPAFVYPVAAHTIWSSNGVFSVTNAKPFRGIGVIDFAGSGVIHLTGGCIALIASCILGPRRGRFHDSSGNILENPTIIPGHSIALQLLGTLILWFGCKWSQNQ